MSGTQKWKISKEKGGKSNYTCKIVALSSLEDIDTKNKNKSA